MVGGHTGPLGRPTLPAAEALHFVIIRREERALLVCTRDDVWINFLFFFYWYLCNHFINNDNLGRLELFHVREAFEWGLFRLPAVLVVDVRKFKNEK